MAKRLKRRKPQRYIKGGRPEIGNLHVSHELKEILDAISEEASMSRALVINLALEEYFGIKR